MSRQLETPEQYAAMLSAVVSLDDLRACTNHYADLAKDACRVVQTMTERDMPEFLTGLRNERRGRFAGEPWAKRYIAILMPEPLFTVAAIADQYKAPFAVTLRRIREVRPELLEPKG